MDNYYGKYELDTAFVKKIDLPNLNEFQTIQSADAKYALAADVYNKVQSDERYLNQ